MLLTFVKKSSSSYISKRHPSILMLIHSKELIFNFELLLKPCVNNLV